MSDVPHLKILVVDRPTTYSQKLRRILTSSTIKSIIPPFELFHVDTVSKALNAYHTFEPDCILLDYDLPDLNGLEFVKGILATENRLPLAVILLADARDETSAIRAIKLGVHDYVLKEFVTPIQLGWTIHNAVERMELDRQVIDKKEELELFASRAAHDLVSPLNNLALFVEHLQDQMEEQSVPGSTENMRSILSIVDHMTTLINGLSTYVQVGHSSSLFEKVDLQELVEYVFLVFEGEIVDSNASIIVQNLPTISGDRSGFAQLFQNLIGNALKYCSREKPEIKLNARQVGNFWHISIRDNGIGIDAKHHQEIFSPFKRLHGRAEYPGSGLGLAICHKIIMQHGGHIWVESEEGDGTTIHLMLPELEEDEPDLGPISQNERSFGQHRYKPMGWSADREVDVDHLFADNLEDYVIYK
ncbi:MAG: ATP-binding protein [Chloroflexota bacterium]